MQVAHGQSQIRIIVGEVFGHSFGQGGHQNPFPALLPIPNLSVQIIHLIAGAAHMYHVGSTRPVGLTICSTTWPFAAVSS
jgi:hypothetical protein